LIAPKNFTNQNSSNINFSVHKINHEDIFGGKTMLDSKIQMNQERFVWFLKQLFFFGGFFFDTIFKNCSFIHIDNHPELKFISCNDDTLILESRDNIKSLSLTAKILLGDEMKQ
jgi:hypothetical protein